MFGLEEWFSDCSIVMMMGTDLFNEVIRLSLYSRAIYLVNAYSGAVSEVLGIRSVY